METPTNERIKQNQPPPLPQSRLEELAGAYWELSSIMGRRPGFTPLATEAILTRLADVAGAAQFKSLALERLASARLEQAIVGGRRKVEKRQNVAVLRVVGSAKPDSLPAQELKTVMNQPSQVPTQLPASN